jgi:hypothetical protein
MSLLDRLHKKSAEDEAIAAYNLGLKAKYDGDWHESLRQNQRADKLRPGDEATIWNLGIAATALSEWGEARRAWRAYGMEVNDGPGEVLWSEFKACVRANPNGAADVVWGMRIDPARIRIENVPLPASERRFGDILINDGAEEGTRISDGREYSVFDELGLWKASPYSTFEVELVLPNNSAMGSLESQCRENGLWVEDWGTIRILCEACSRGTPGEHVCSNEPTGQQKYGFAAKSESELRRVLNTWIETEDGAGFGAVFLVVSGVNG